MLVLQVLWPECNWTPINLTDIIRFLPSPLPWFRGMSGKEERGERMAMSVVLGWFQDMA